MDEVAEQQDISREISEAISTPFGGNTYKKLFSFENDIY